MYAQYVYAQLFTTLLVSMMYTAGAPILYLITFINVVIMYWVYKSVIVYYYKLTTEFDENFVNYATHFFKIAVILHLGVSLIMFTNH